jgi:tetratricopeptide (TPR) repeat protein
MNNGDDRVECPYVGLRPFTKHHRKYFHGRSKDIQLISYNLIGTHLTILYGASGVGKSSVLQAGVLPEVANRQGTASVYWRKWQGDDFARQLKTECLKSLGIDWPSIETPIDKIPFDEFVQRATVLADRRLLLVLDQFEEYLAQHPGESTSGGFDSALARLVNHPDIRINILIGIREDGLWSLDLRFQARISGLLDNTLRLAHLNLAAAREAIVGPLKMYSQMASPDGPTTIEAALVDEILREVTPHEKNPLEPEDRVEAPYLQLILTRLWFADKARSEMKLDTFRRIGGAGDIVLSHLTTVLRQLSRRDRSICARIFPHMVTPSGFKIPQRPADLNEYAKVKDGAVGKLLSRLSDDSQIESSQTRILRRIDQPERYEIFHDVLGRAIQRWLTRYTVMHRVIAVTVPAVAVFALVLSGFALFQRSQAVVAREEAVLSAKLATAERDALQAQLRDIDEQRALEAVTVNVGKMGDLQARLQQARERVKAGDIPGAEKLLQAELKTRTDPGERMSILGTLGFIKRDSKDLSAIPYYEQALDLSRQLNDKKVEAEMLLAIAYQRERQGDPVQASKAIEQAIVVTKQSKDTALRADLHSRLASIHEKQGDTRTAAGHYEEALAIYRSMGAKQQASSTLVRLSAINQNLGNTKSAQRQLNEAQHYEAAPIQSSVPPPNINKPPEETTVEPKSIPPQDATKIAIPTPNVTPKPSYISITETLPVIRYDTAPGVSTNFTIADQNGDQIRAGHPVKVEFGKYGRKVSLERSRFVVLNLPTAKDIDVEAKADDFEDSGPIRFRGGPEAEIRLLRKGKVMIECDWSALSSWSFLGSQKVDCGNEVHVALLTLISMLKQYKANDTPLLQRIQSVDWARLKQDSAEFLVEPQFRADMEQLVKDQQWIKRDQNDYVEGVGRSFGLTLELKATSSGVQRMKLDTDVDLRSGRRPAQRGTIAILFSSTSADTIAIISMAEFRSTFPIQSKFRSRIAILRRGRSDPLWSH